MRARINSLVLLFASACTSVLATETIKDPEKIQEVAEELLADKKYGEALPLVESLSRSGSQWGTFMLANYYICGRVVKFSCARAEQLFTNALDPQNSDESNSDLTRSAKNEIAWINAACEQDGFRGNPAKALRLAFEAVKDEAEAYSVDTLAAVLARSGDFSRAVDAQRIAIKKLAKLSEDEEVPSYTHEEFKKRLVLYEQKQPASFSEATAKANCNALPD